MPSPLNSFVRDHTKISRPPLCPEIQLRLATEMMPLWRAAEERLSVPKLPPPLWAFCWAGGQALARYVLDNPFLVEGKRVLDFASGGGVCAIAAAMAGAQTVTANDIDPFAPTAAKINAALNGVNVTICKDNLVGEKSPGWDVILAGDICYDRSFAEGATPWLHGLAKTGTLVLLGDPGRPYLPKDRLKELARYTCSTPLETEDTKIKEGIVLQILVDKI